MTLRSMLRDELRVVVERHLADRDPVSPGDVDDLAARAAAYEQRVPASDAVATDLKSLVDQLSAFTRQLVGVRQVCSDALRTSRDAHTKAEHALARAEAVASEVP